MWNGILNYRCDEVIITEINDNFIMCLWPSGQLSQQFWRQTTCRTTGKSKFSSWFCVRIVGNEKIINKVKPFPPSSFSQNGSFSIFLQSYWSVVFKMWRNPDQIAVGIFFPHLDEMLGLARVQEWFCSILVAPLLYESLLLRDVSAHCVKRASVCRISHLWKKIDTTCKQFKTYSIRFY